MQRVLWGSYVGGDLDGGRGASTRRRACAHAGEPGRVQWTSRRAYGIHQRSVGELMGGIGSRGGKPHGRMLPQLSRFGMNVAKQYFNLLGSCNFKWLRVAETAHPTTIARLIGRSVFGGMV